jgi:hypothetical protein
MPSYETIATVEKEGTVQVSGVPFEAGTEVEVVIRPARNGADGSGHAEQLLAALNAGRNRESVGPLNRAALYDRDVVH